MINKTDIIYLLQLFTIYLKARLKGLTTTYDLTLYDSVIKNSILTISVFILLGRTFQSFLLNHKFINPKHLVFNYFSFLAISGLTGFYISYKNIKRVTNELDVKYSLFDTLITNFDNRIKLN